MFPILEFFQICTFFLSFRYLLFFIFQKTFVNIEGFFEKFQFVDYTCYEAPPRSPPFSLARRLPAIVADVLELRGITNAFLMHAY